MADGEERIINDESLELLQKLQRVATYLVEELGHEPTTDEIAHTLGLPADQIRVLFRAVAELKEEEYAKRGSLEQFIPDYLTRTPDEIVAEQELDEATRGVLSLLTPREEKVLKMLFGIGERRDHTFEEIAQDFDVTPERIRQITAKALRKLRHPTRSKQLRSFYS